jgi:hypothetical protein
MSLVTDFPLIFLAERFAVCRLPAESPYPEWAPAGNLLALVSTPTGLTVVCEERYAPPEVKAERGWRAFQVQGPLDFTLVGVLAAIAAPLAQAGVGIFVISTYETDYILVKETALERARQALSLAGFLVLNDDHLSA